MSSGRFGKVDRDFLGRVLLKNTGAPSADVIVGPGIGLDNAVIRIGGGRVMVVTADPLSIVPSLGMKDSAWLTVHELASDFTSSAVSPQFAVLDYNLPQSLGMPDFEKYTRSLSEECSSLGISIVGGHTGRYPGADFTVVGGGMLMGTAEEDRYVTPAMAGEGDVVLMTKSAAIEATAVLARSFPEKVEQGVGGRMARRAARLLRSCSTVEDARTASSVGTRREGVTSMHDATEGGVAGGLYELARASMRSLTVDAEEVSVSEECELVCSLFGLDPLTTLGEGSLIITCKRDVSREVLGRLSGRSIRAKVIGRVGDRGGGRLLVKKKGTAKPYAPPRDDPYWRVYAEGIANGWK